MRILLFSSFALPDSCANATRAISFAKIYKELGYEVDLLGINYDKARDLEGVCDSIEYSMIMAGPWTGWRAYKRVNQIKRDIKAYLDAHSVSGNYDAILLSDVYYDFSDIFLKYAKKHNTKLIVNSVEWYDKNNVQFAGVRGKINFIKNRIALRSIHVRMKNIIAISSLLDNYYSERGCNTVTVPTIVDLEKYKGVVRNRKDDGVVRIAYAGVPGRKDYVINAIHAFSLLDEDEKSRLELHFYGPTDKELGLSEEFLDKNGKYIKCHGKIPHSEVKNAIADADFTVLLRPNKRYANAGFPTKVGESMACGTPVIANITSDLAKYIKDGETGIVVGDESAEGCAAALRRVLSLPHEELENMRIRCFEMALKAFSYSAYTEAIASFMKTAR